LSGIPGTVHLTESLVGSIKEFFKAKLVPNKPLENSLEEEISSFEDGIPNLRRE
jgi:hypothetical protein